MEGVDMIEALAQVKAYFTAHIEATLAAIEAEKGIVIPRPKTMATHEIKSLQLPAIEILPEESTPEYFYSETPDQGFWDHHAISVEIGVAGTDPKTVQDALLCYRKAIKRMVQASVTCDGAFNRWRLGRTNYSPLIESEKEKKCMKILKQGLICRTLAA